jgi:predicted nucleic acid-binding protein
MDTVCLSNFALVNHLGILVTRYGKRAHLTQQVMDEICDGISAGHSALLDIETAVSSGRFSKVEFMSDGEREHFRSLLRGLGPGEASCISCATSRGGIVVTDDWNARQACKACGLRFTGTIGILKACVMDGTFQPAEADELLKEMIREGDHSPVTSISSLV